MSGFPEGKLRTACRRVLPCGSFAADKNRRDGHQARCRECVAKYGAMRYRRRREAMGKTVREKVGVPPGHKLCRTCGVIKSHAERNRNGRASDGLSTRCKPCRAAENRAAYFKRQYGITEAERDGMITSQMGLCAICPLAPAAHVDHCHETGRVRGVLCFNCNSAIGELGDDPDAVRRAVAYLEGNSWKPTLVAPGVYQLPS